MNLFDEVEKQKRLRLEFLGWKRLAGNLHGWPAWEDADGKVANEKKAFEYLDSLDKEKSSDD